MMWLIKSLILYGIGGLSYIAIELLWRGHTHWTMFLVGGICFLIVGNINEYYSWDISLIKQSIIGAVAVTIIEFFAGIILNKWLNLGIWDYSNLPFNILGQICLPFTLIWCFLSAIAIIIDDYIRHWLFKEEKPKYHIF